MRLNRNHCSYTPEIRLHCANAKHPTFIYWYYFNAIWSFNTLSTLLLALHLEQIEYPMLLSFRVRSLIGVGVKQVAFIFCMWLITIGYNKPLFCKGVLCCFISFAYGYIVSSEGIKFYCVYFLRSISSTFG